MDTPNFEAAAGFGIIGFLIAIILYAAIVFFTLWIAYTVIRLAVRRALWDHSDGIGRPKKR